MLLSHSQGCTTNTQCFVFEIPKQPLNIADQKYSQATHTHVHTHTVCELNLRTVIPPAKAVQYRYTQTVQLVQAPTDHGLVLKGIQLAA